MTAVQPSRLFKRMESLRLLQRNMTPNGGPSDAAVQNAFRAQAPSFKSRAASGQLRGGMEPLGASRQSPLVKETRAMLNVLQSIRRWRRRNATIAQLYRLDDRLLADIGIVRSNIPEIARRIR